MSHTKRITNFSDKHKRWLFELDHVRWTSLHVQKTGQIINHPKGWHVFDGENFIPLASIHLDCEFFYPLNKETPLYSSKVLEEYCIQFMRDDVPKTDILMYDEEADTYHTVNIRLAPSPYDPKEKVFLLTPSRKE